MFYDCPISQDFHACEILGWNDPADVVERCCWYWRFNQVTVTEVVIKSAVECQEVEIDWVLELVTISHVVAVPAEHRLADSIVTAVQHIVVIAAIDLVMRE